MKDQRDLHVFSHIPKTAGSNFKHSIELSNHRAFVLRTAFSFHGPCFNLHTGKNDYFRGKEHFHEYLNSLNQTQKNRVHCIAGHDSYYGIHEVFGRPAKYSTFIREPVSRTLSLYNFERNRWEFYRNEIKNPTLGQIGCKRRVNEHFAINGQAPDFETWLDKVYNQQHIFYLTMTNFLQHLNFIGEKRNQSDVQEALKKFDFVGICESFDVDAAYLYHPFNVKSSMGDTNKSPQYVKIGDLSSSVIQRIKELNQDDMLLYECALQKNAEYKKNTKDFYIKVAETNRRRRLYYPIDWTKHTVKNILRPVLKPILIQLGLR